MNEFTEADQAALNELLKKKEQWVDGLTSAVHQVLPDMDYEAVGQLIERADALVRVLTPLCSPLCRAVPHGELRFVHVRDRAPGPSLPASGLQFSTALDADRFNSTPWCPGAVMKCVSTGDFVVCVGYGK